MITLDSLTQKPAIVCSEVDDVIILDNFHYFGIQSIVSFEDDTYCGNVHAYFEKYFQYTVDGIHWSEWLALSDLNLSSINTKINHIFSIRYKYISKGASEVTKLYFHSIKLNVVYSEPLVPSFYRNFFINRYFGFFNTNSIEWSVNVLNKIFQKGIVPEFIERNNNINWEDEDFINFWWTIIYFQSLKVSYDEIFTELFHYPYLLKEFIKQKGLYVSNDSSIDEYYYIVNHYYDEVMKRGSASVLDKNRTVPNDYNGVSIKGELLRLCNQRETVESVFGVISEYETGWIVGDTSPIYNYPDFYRDFIRAYELTAGIDNINLYPIYNPDYITEEGIVVDGVTINALKINTGATGQLAGIVGIFQDSLLVDNDSDYEISFKIKGLQVNNRLFFEIDAYNSLGIQVSLQDIKDLSSEDVILDTTTLSGDLFVRGNVLFKERASYESNIELPGQKTLRFVDGVDRMNPTILISCNNDCYLYDIKVKVLPVTNAMSYLITAGELIIKLYENLTEFSKEEIIKIINETLIPISMNIAKDERIGVSEADEYIPYTLPFILRLQ